MPLLNCNALKTDPKTTNVSIIYTVHMFLKTQCCVILKIWSPGIMIILIIRRKIFQKSVQKVLKLGFYAATPTSSQVYLFFTTTRPPTFPYPHESVANGSSQLFTKCSRTVIVKLGSGDPQAQGSLREFQRVHSKSSLVSKAV
jgi:hypothetical protein